MKNKTFIYTLGLIFFVLALLISSVEVVGFSTRFYQTQYQRLNTAQSMDLSQDDLMRATHTLLDYIQDKQDHLDLSVSVNGQPIEMFNEKEKEHMVDVKALFQGFNRLKNVFFGISLSLFTLALIKKDAFNRSLGKKVLKKSGVTLFSLLFALGFYALIDFNGFWTLFHQLLFRNDLWLLDPKTDRMINMFPEIFFNTMVFRILGLFILLNIVVLSLYSGFMTILKRKEGK